MTIDKLRERKHDFDMPICQGHTAKVWFDDGEGAMVILYELADGTTISSATRCDEDTRSFVMNEAWFAFIKAIFDKYGNTVQDKESETA